MKKFKILLSTVISIFLISSVAYAADNLFEYYQQKGEKLPSITERGKIYKNMAPDNYKGTLTQNRSLLDYLVSTGQNQGQNEENLGGIAGSAHLPKVIANFEDSLVSKITSTATSLTLVKGTTPAGNSLSGWYGLTLEAGSSNQEFILANCTATACSSLTRGLSTDTGTSTVASLKFEHRRGASVKITDYPNLTIITNILNGADGIPDKLYYDSQPTITSNEDLATKKYVDDVALVSAPDATESVKGVSELATGAEAAAGTSSGSAARLVLPASLSNSNSSATNIIPVTGADGKLSANFIATSSNYTWTGNNTFSGSNTFTGSTNSGLVGEVKAYASSTVPTGWLACNGATVSSTTYATLFALIGYTYGGTPGNNFVLPDLRGRNILMASSTPNMGQSGGESNHTQTVNEMPAHHHSGGDIGGSTQGNTGALASGNTGDTGGGLPFNVLDPYLVLNYIIKY